MAARRKTAVLLGAGHAHLYSIQRAAEFRRRGFDLVLIAPGSFWYSGLATGMLGGRYPPAEDQIDVAALVQAGGGRFVSGRARHIDLARRVVVLESGEEIAYDALSINVGSEARALPGSDENYAKIYALKPLENLWRLRRDLEAAGVAWRRVVIVGGGASGGEVASNVRALLDRLGAWDSEVIVLNASERLFAQFAPTVARKAARALQTRRIEVRLHTCVAHVERGAVITENGERLTFDFLVNAAGLQSPAFLRESGLATDEYGALRVNRFLQAVDQPAIFGGGDCVAFDERPLAKIGVYAVREAPILFYNLLATLRSTSLRAYQPQRNFLLILNLGNGEGLAVWRKFSWQGRAAFWLKDFLDRRFLAASRRAVS